MRRIFVCMVKERNRLTGEIADKLRELLEWMDPGWFRQLVSFVLFTPMGLHVGKGFTGRYIWE